MCAYVNNMQLFTAIATLCCMYVSLCVCLHPNEEKTVQWRQRNNRRGGRGDLRRRRRGCATAAAHRACVAGGRVGLVPRRGLRDRRQPRLLAHQRSHGGGGDLREGSR